MNERHKWHRNHINASPFSLFPSSFSFLLTDEAQPGLKYWRVSYPLWWGASAMLMHCRRRREEGGCWGSRDRDIGVYKHRIMTWCCEHGQRGWAYNGQFSKSFAALLPHAFAVKWCRRWLLSTPNSTGMCSNPRRTNIFPSTTTYRCCIESV